MLFSIRRNSNIQLSFEFTLKGVEMRSIWKGSLGFGMVAIPIKLYGATDDKRIAMNQLHTECGSRIKMPRYCPKCDRQLEAGEIVKGYPIDKDHYVPVTPEELDNLHLNSLRSIQVDAFVKSVEDPRYFKTSYLLSPDEARRSLRPGSAG